MAGSQLSAPLQNSPSLHRVSSGTHSQPKPSRQVSRVQPTPSAPHGDPVVTQPTDASQISSPVQNNPSSHRKLSGSTLQNLMLSPHTASVHSMSSWSIP